MNKYFKFILNLTILLFFIVLADQITGRVLQYYYFKQSSGLYYRTTYSIDSTTAEILVFGSSRANHHYVPEIFEDSLNLSFYNSGRDGNFLLFNYAVFKAVVKRYKPKIVVFDINLNELDYDEKSYERLSALLPYYKSHSEIRDIVELNDPFEKFKMVSAIYPYNSSMVTIGIGNLEFNAERKNDRKGYVPLEDSISDTVLHKIESGSFLADTNNVKALNYIIRYCKGNQIDLILIQSPVYAIVQETASSDILEKMAVQNKVLYLDYINSPEFLENPEYFQDQDHLNNKGAVRFSRITAQKIKDIL